MQMMTNGTWECSTDRFQWQPHNPLKPALALQLLHRNLQLGCDAALAPSETTTGSVCTGKSANTAHSPRVAQVLET
eukprot:161872-Amphidinium_carterae.1